MTQRLSQTKRTKMMMAFIAVPTINYVARVCEVGWTTAKRYSVEDNWEAAQAVFAESLVEAGLPSLEHVRAEIDVTANALLHEFRQDVALGNIRCRSVGDFVALSQFRLFIRGEPSERLAVGVLPGGKSVLEANPDELEAGVTKYLEEVDHYRRALDRIEKGNANGNGAAKAIEAEVVPAKPGKGKG